MSDPPVFTTAAAVALSIALSVLAVLLRRVSVTLAQLALAAVRDRDPSSPPATPPE
jgi:hypothetical protein